MIDVLNLIFGWIFFFPKFDSEWIFGWAHIARARYRGAEPIVPRERDFIVLGTNEVMFKRDRSVKTLRSVDRTRMAGRTIVLLVVFVVGLSHYVCFSGELRLSFAFCGSFHRIVAFSSFPVLEFNFSAWQARVAPRTRLLFTCKLDSN